MRNALADCLSDRVSACGARTHTHTPPHSNSAGVVAPVGHIAYMRHARSTVPAVPCTVATIDSSHSHSAARPARSMREQVSRLVVGCGTAVVLGCLGCELELAVCLAPAHAICAQVHVLRGPSTALGRGAQVRSGEAKWLVVASATLFDLLFFLLLAFSL